MKKLIKIIIFILVIVIVGSVLFIKFNTPAAAEFTDNVLRPILGNKPVGFLEKTYYNLSDKVQQITDHTGADNIPSFTQSGGEISGTPIPKTNNFSEVAGEGIWKNIPLKIFPNDKVLAYTFVRPDPDRPFAYVTLVQMNMAKLNLGDVAGTAQPGGAVGNPGPGKIPDNIVKNGLLVTAFNGGFQYRDGMYGMIADGKTYLPLKKDVGSIVGYKNGSIKIINYQGQDLGPNVAFVRQNCPILLENGNISILDEKNKKLWGRTFNADIFSWRSGIGITDNGNLIYAVGNNLSPLSLSTALKMAGAKDAIQLDINPFWVRFTTFDYLGDGNYSSNAISKGIYNGAKQFIGGYEKDFFFTYKK